MPDENEAPLPRSMLVLTSPELDHDESTARAAAEEIYAVHSRMVYGLCDLESLERALGLAEPVSARAHDARAEIRRAINGLTEVIGGTSGACDALVFGWKSA